MVPPKCIPLRYSLKNIPIPSNNVYMKALVEKVESLIKRMRWRAFFYLKGGDDRRASNAEDHYPGLISRKCPPQVEELMPFEEDMLRLVESIKFRRVSDSFQDTLKKDIDELRKSAEVIVRADKPKTYTRYPPSSMRSCFRIM